MNKKLVLKASLVSLSVIIMASSLIITTTAGKAGNNPTTNSVSKKCTVNRVIADTSVPANFNTFVEGNSYGTFKSFTYYSNITKTQRPANIILPKNYSKKKKYPVLYMLHGIMCNQNSWGTDDTSSLNYMYGNLQSIHKAAEMIIVMPNIRVSTTEETNAFTADNYKNYDLISKELAENLMPYMKKNYSIKTGRENTAVAGFSMGGRESINCGFSNPELFGYVGAFCPAPGVLANNEFDANEAGLFTPETLTLPRKFMNNTMVMIVKGADDTVVKENPSLYHDTLTKNKVPHYYYETAGGHEEKVWGNGFYNFMKRIFGKNVE